VDAASWLLVPPSACSRGCAPSAALRPRPPRLPLVPQRRRFGSDKISPREAAFRAEQERLRRAQEAKEGGSSWWGKYNKTYTGAEAEGAWQAAGAVTLGVVFIGLPVLYALMTTVIRTRNEGLSAANRAQGEEIQRQVLERKVRRINEIRREQGLEEIALPGKEGGGAGGGEEGAVAR
jgi:hypothetical protein